MDYRAIATLASLTHASCMRYPDASGHLIRTSIIASCLAGIMGLDAAEQQCIRLATPVHDLGKLAIPDRVLLKPAKLDPEERRIMERHSRIGAELLAGSIHELHQYASVIARHHHERFDGSGYPDHLVGQNVPLPARVVAVADAFDAMTEARCYRPSMTDDEAKAVILEGSGTHFDPVAAQAFLGGFPSILRARRAANELLSLGSDATVVARLYGLTRRDFAEGWLTTG
ncbi:HD-GYP domain-containing protein [Cupriavidus sp. IK-TO18]|uniref:HD-GYP domain-containing protein n=1 Tax=Cupriavidus sp. IK-TO18 TaxID=2782182 RepID=UPI00189C30FB|nr:HD domain-containing phosphohydrolase [Cupriavidus sp. IK-TO18]MBF6992344.1 HD domain-containing protein [Cupriavidus sp. IK-TO18]